MIKRLALTLILFTMGANFLVHSGQSMRYVVQNDGIIEWHSYTNSKLV